MIKELESLYSKILDNPSVLEEICKEIPKFVFACDENGDTLLHYAIYDNEFELVKLLSESGACPFVYNNNAVDAISLAAGNDNVGILKFLTEQYLVGIGENTMWSMLVQASSNGLTDNVRFLLEKEFYKDKLFEGDDPLIFWALQSENLKLIKLLIDNKIPLDSREDGETPLHAAAAAGYLEIVELMLNCGIDVNAKTNDGSTPLMLASAYDNTDVIRLLIRNKADVNASDNTGVTSLFCAVEQGHIESVKILLKNHALTNVCDMNNNHIDFYIQKAEDKEAQDTMKNLINLYHQSK